MSSYMRWIVSQIAGKWPSRKKKQRRGPERDPAYLRWIRKQPCCVCSALEIQQFSRTEAAHVGPHGVSQKTSDYETVPLCQEHHALLHRSGRRAFELRRGVVLADVITTLKRLWEMEQAGACRLERVHE